MNHQVFVDTCASPCAVLSVEKTADGHCGAIHIVCANEAYRRTMGPGYYDGMPYEELVPKDNKFEDFCFRAAFNGERMHAYVPTPALGTWTDQYHIPLQPASEWIGYDQFVFEFTKTAQPERMAALSPDVVSAAMQATIKLVGAADFRGVMREVLSDILDFADAGSCRIILVDREKHEVMTFSEKLRGDQLPEGIPTNTELPYELVSTWEDAIGVSNAVIIQNDHDMDELAKSHAAWVESMRTYDVRTLVLIPLRRNGFTLGFLYVINFDVEREVAVKELLELMSYLLGAELANFQLMRRMEEMSTVDPLTGLLNRHAMKSHVRELSQAEKRAPYGVINLDLNGLKATNDEHGHDAGDALLVEAAELLQKQFHRKDVFRTGGDEFVVIASDIGRDSFERKARDLREAMRMSDSVSFAIGTCWSDGTMDIHEAYRISDERMYADKHLYYQTHPKHR